MASLAALAGEAQAFVWPNAKDRAVAQLKSTDPDERVLAIGALRSLPAEAAKPHLLTALSDEDSAVRVAAARAAARLNWPEASDIVAGWLADSDAKVRLAACEAIRAAPTPKSITALGRVLGDPAEDVRMAAVSALGKTTSEEAATLLLGHLDDPSPEVRAEVATSLGRIGDARAVLPLVGKVQDGTPLVRRRVARALGSLGDVKAVAALVMALQDQASEVKIEAALALGRVGGEDAVNALGQYATQKIGLGSGGTPATESAVALRAAAVRSLARIGTDAALAVLVDALQADRLEKGRAPARDALASMGPRAVKPLASTLPKAPTTEVGSLVTQALAQIGDPAAVDALVASLRRGAVPQAETLRALGAVPSKASLAAVLESLDSSSAEVRAEALRATISILDRLGADGRVVDPAIDAFDAPELRPDERLLLIELLGKSGGARALEKLLPLAAAKNVSVRRAVVRALGDLGQASEPVDQALAAALNDELGSIRMEAAKALMKVGRGALAPAMVTRLVEADEQDRAAIGLALSGILRRVTDAKVLADVAKKLERAPASARDSLLDGLLQNRAEAEAFGAIPSSNEGDRKKLAELADPVGAGLNELVTLAKDESAAVRANAAWTLGFASDTKAAPSLVALLADLDASVAANAAASLGRLAGALATPDVAAPLCDALTHGRPYVRANAAAGLMLSAATCDAGKVGARLASDRNELARVALARLLSLRATDEVASRALRRCAAEDGSVRVAKECERALLQPFVPEKPGAASVTVFVVPDGADQPTAEAAFTLVRPDGTFRLGFADRRGAVVEQHLSRTSEVSLGVPAALLFE